MQVEYLSVIACQTRPRRSQRTPGKRGSSESHHSPAVFRKTSALTSGQMVALRCLERDVTVHRPLYALGGTTAGQTTMREEITNEGKRRISE